MRFTTLATFACAVMLMTGCASRDTDGPSLGTWRLMGEDTNAQIWTATFTLERMNAVYSGTFEWKKNGANAGVESFTGTYDAAGKTITFTGQQTTGAVVKATYSATVSSEKTSMTDGRWISSGGPAGTWHAERVQN